MTKCLSFVAGVSGDCDAAYGRARLRITSEKPLGVRKVNAGIGRILAGGPSMAELLLVKGGESLPDGLSAGITSSQTVSFVAGPEYDGESAEFEMEGLRPATGLFTREFQGVLKAPAAVIECSKHSEIWVFVLTSPQALRVDFRKPTLRVAHGGGEATADLRVDPDGNLVMELSAHDTGFHGISLAMRRSMEGLQFEEPIGDFEGAGPTEQTLSWAPVSLGWDTVLICDTKMSMEPILSLATEAGEPLEGDGLGLSEDFVLGDGSGVEYSLRLTGIRPLMGNVHDETEVLLTQ